MTDQPTCVYTVALKRETLSSHFHLEREEFLCELRQDWKVSIALFDKILFKTIWRIIMVEKSVQGAKKSDDPSANQFGVGYDGVDPASPESTDAENQFGTGYDGVDSISDEKPVNQFGTGYDGADPISDEPVNQFGVGYGGVDDSVIEDPYGALEDEQDDDRHIDIER